MSLMVCGQCKAAYAPAEACPQCGDFGFRFDWEEEDMPKATVEGGASGHDEMTPAEAEPVAEEKPKPAPKPKVATVKAAADK